jgi:hypothetical protein
VAGSWDQERERTEEFREEQLDFRLPGLGHEATTPAVPRAFGASGAPQTVRLVGGQGVGHALGPGRNVDRPGWPTAVVAPLPTAPPTPATAR